MPIKCFDWYNGMIQWTDQCKLVNVPNQVNWLKALVLSSFPLVLIPGTLISYFQVSTLYDV